MNRVSINPGRVEWCGENPGIYLKDQAGDRYSTLALFFRIVLSPYGRGCACLVLGKPDEARGWPEVPNLLLTDNQRLMRWIVDGWVRRMPLFRDRPGLDGATWLHLEASVHLPAGSSRHAETLRGSGVTVEMIWDNLGSPLPVEVGTENSATGKHEMYAVFVESQAARVLINGTVLPGQVTDRELFGRSMKSAFLALSETWVTPAGKEE